MTESSIQYGFRRINLDTDFEDVFALYSWVFGIDATPENWRWKFLPPWVDKPYVWVVLDQESIIGYIGAMPAGGIDQGEEVPFFQMGDAMLHPRFRGKYDYIGTSTRNFVEEIRREIPHSLIYGFSAHRGFLWYQRVGLIEGVEKVTELIVPCSQRGQSSSFNFEIWSWDDGRIDSLWQDMKHSFTIGLVRDQAYLEWRYGAHPMFKYQLIGVFEDEQPIGWLVMAGQWELDGRSRNQGRVIDILLPEAGYHSVLQKMAQTFNTDSLKLWLPARMSEKFAENKTTSVNVLHFGQSSPVSTQYLRDNLFYTFGDADWN